MRSSQSCPRELSGSDYVYAVDATEDLVAAGTSQSAHLALLNPEDPEEYSVVEVPSGTVAKHRDRRRDGLLFTSGGALWRLGSDDDEPEEMVEADPPGGPKQRPLFYQDGILHGTGSLGYVWTYDLDSDEYERTSLIDAQRDGDVEDAQLSRAEPAQSLAASDDAVYTGGHFTLGIRDEENDELQQQPVPGEAKATALIGDDLALVMQFRVVSLSATTPKWRT